MAYPQSAFAAEPFGPQPFPWAGCLHGASAIRICSRAIRAPTSPTSLLGGLPAGCIRNLQLQTSHSDPTTLLGGLPAWCIRNPHLQPSHSSPNPSLGRAACMAYLQSAFVAEPFVAEPFGPQPFPWAGCLHGASAIRICSRAIRAPTLPLGGLPAWCILPLAWCR